MLDVFQEEDETTIKDGMANLYWFRGDLKKAFLRARVEPTVAHDIYAVRRTDDGRPLSKRQMMDALYEELRQKDKRERIEISREFVRILVEWNSFVPRDPKHRVDIAERCALKLRERIREQRERRATERVPRRNVDAAQVKATNLERIRTEFAEAMKLEPVKRGYKLEKLFPDFMRAEGIEVQEPFRIKGEQIDGAIKYDGHYYLVELKWTAKKAAVAEVSSLYHKVEGKLDARGLLISMNGFSSEVLASTTHGKAIRVLFLDGVHLTNSISGLYTFGDLLDHAVREASSRGNVYCSHEVASYA